MICFGFDWHTALICLGSAILLMWMSPQAPKTPNPKPKPEPRPKPPHAGALRQHTGGPFSPLMVSFATFQDLGFRGTHVKKLLLDRLRHASRGGGRDGRARVDELRDAKAASWLRTTSFTPSKLYGTV